MKVVAKIEIITIIFLVDNEFCGRDKVGAALEL